MKIPVKESNEEVGKNSGVPDFIESGITEGFMKEKHTVFYK